MKLKKPKLEINPEKPFENDKLNRKDNADVLTDIINSIDEPFVLGIDGGWGMGKTTFLNMWRYDLEIKGYTCLYFNAWENDYASDPLVAFIGEITTALKNAKVTDEDERIAREIIQKIKKYGRTIAARLIPTAAKLATYGILDLDKITEKTVSDAIGSIVEEQIDKYEEDKNTINYFREALEEFATRISVDKENPKPIIFFIDELDRCKPTYAIESLERLKHLFNVTGYIYAIAMDRVQIGHSIRSQYGLGFDSDGYLRRFFDLEYKLPVPSRLDYTNFLFQQFNIDDALKKWPDGYAIRTTTIIEVFSYMSERYNLSLRDMGQCFTQFTLAIRSTSISEHLHEVFLAFLIALRKGSQDIYDSYVQGKINGEHVLSELTNDIIGKKIIEKTKYGPLIETYLMIGRCTNENEFNLLIESLVHTVNNTASKDPVKRQAERILKNVEQFRDESNILNLLHSRIEATTNFL